jgi:hypothetical protein
MTRALEEMAEARRDVSAALMDEASATTTGGSSANDQS